MSHRDRNSLLPWTTAWLLPHSNLGGQASTAFDILRFCLFSRRGVSMKISEQAKKQIQKLIDEGEGLDPFNLEAFYRWTQDSYEALGFHPLQQQRFDKYCRGSCDSKSMRLYVGLWTLKQALYKENP
jgi:hypothetical protein